MEIIILEIIYFLIGGVTGVLAGLLGVGGGVIMMPTLYFTLSVLGVESEHLPFVAIATSHFAGVFASVSSSINHFKNKNLELKKALLLGAASVASASVIPFFAVNIPPSILTLILVGVLFATALKLLFERTHDNEEYFKINPFWLAFIGILVGALSALTGLGGGVVFVPTLMYLYSLGTKRSIGTSSAVVPFTTFASAVSYSFSNNAPDYLGQIGYINLIAGAPLAVGAVLGARFGVMILINSKINIVKRIFACLIIVAILQLLAKNIF